MDFINAKEGDTNTNTARGEQNSAEVLQDMNNETPGAARFSLKITKKPVPSTPRGVLAE
jgi:hypothetical protein